MTRREFCIGESSESKHCLDLIYLLISSKSFFPASKQRAKVNPAQQHIAAGAGGVRPAPRLHPGGGGGGAPRAARQDQERAPPAALLRRGHQGEEEQLALRRQYTHLIHHVVLILDITLCVYEIEIKCVF